MSRLFNRVNRQPFTQHLHQFQNKTHWGQLDREDENLKILSSAQGIVAGINYDVGDTIRAGEVVVVTELMKMLTENRAPCSGILKVLHVNPSDMVEEGDLLFEIEENADSRSSSSGPSEPAQHPAQAELEQRRRMISDEGRQDRVARRHALGNRTARENLNDLVDQGSFSEIGAHALAAQHSTHDLDTLIDRSAADGVIVGTGLVDGAPVAVLIVDYTVMAGTQGHFHHKKVDRIVELAHRRKLPLIMYPEGGGGRPNDIDAHLVSIAQLELTTFQRLAGLGGVVPVIAVVNGFCFAGSAAFAAVADIIIATQNASIGMGGPAMIEGGGLGSFAPEDVGPASMHARTGAIDVLCEDEAEATATAKRLLALLNGTSAEPVSVPDGNLDASVPADRRSAFDMRNVILKVVDLNSFIELKKTYGSNMIIGLASLDGKPIGIMANSSQAMGGAIDGDAASKAADLFDLCETHKIPILSFVDTPGFMVGPEAEETGQIKPIGNLFKNGARFSHPVICVVVRRAYGLGAMAMAGGGMHASDLTLAWPQGEFGAMGLEGAVRLGYREQLAAIEDDDARANELDRLIAGLQERGRALNAATFFEIDDVIQPNETRNRVISAFAAISVGKSKP